MSTSASPASEEPIPGLSGATLVEAVRAHGHRNVSYVEKRADVATALLPRLEKGDLVLTLGAGDITQVGPELLELLGARR